MILCIAGTFTCFIDTSGSMGGYDCLPLLQRAYDLAKKNDRPACNNRVILATDSDFNVGISNVDDLKQFISGKKNDGIHLSVLAFGVGDTRDSVMETLAANGNYAYIDSPDTARKVPML